MPGAAPPHHHDTPPDFPSILHAAVPLQEAPRFRGRTLAMPTHTHAHQHRSTVLAPGLDTGFDDQAFSCADGGCSVCLGADDPDSGLATTRHGGGGPTCTSTTPRLPRHRAARYPFPTP